MINLTRRNFLIGAAASGLLVLQPPALKLVEVEELIVTKPKLVMGIIRGTTGKLTRETTPGPHDIFVENFTMATEAELGDMTSLGAEYRSHFVKCIDYTVEAWVRSEANYIGSQMQLSLKAGPNTFYRGDFFITGHNFDFTDYSSLDS